MAEQNSPIPAGTSPQPGPNPQISKRTPGGRRLRPIAATVYIAIAVTYAAGALIFRAAGFRRGYGDGYKSVGYYEGAAIADSMKAFASSAVLGLAGLMPDSSQCGTWHVARFGLTPARKLCRYGGERALDTMMVPSFSEHARAPVGRSYRSASSGRIYHVDH